MIEQIMAFAMDGGYEAFYIPTDANISSNRSDISKAIEKAGYTKKTIPQVDWDTVSPHPFTEVYEVWVR